MNFTFTSLKAAEKALTNLRARVWQWSMEPDSNGHTAEAEEYRRRFWEAVDSDLNLPGALAVAWEMARSNLPGRAKLELMLDFDRMFGLDLHQVPARQRCRRGNRGLNPRAGIPASTADLGNRRFHALPPVRRRLHSAGRSGRLPRPPQDAHGAAAWTSGTPYRRRGKCRPGCTNRRSTISASFSTPTATRRTCAAASTECCATPKGHSAEIIVIDSGSTDGTGEMLEEMRQEHDNLRVIHCDHVIGDAASKNIGIKQSLGKYVIIVDGSAEITGDILGPVSEQLSDPTVGIFGPYGLTTDDMQHFHEEVDRGEADAMQAYCMSFRREAVNAVGLMREVFPFLPQSRH